MPCELVHSDVYGPFSKPTCGDHPYYIPLINNYMWYTFVWLLPNKTAMTCTSLYQSFQAQVDSMGYKMKRPRCDYGQGEYNNNTFWYGPPACGTTYQPCPQYAHHKNGIADFMICTITEKAWAMMIDSQVPVQFWGGAFDAAVYLHKSSGNEGQKGTDRDGYQAPYKTPYVILHGFRKPTHNADGNKILCQASLHNLHQFR